MIELLFRLGSEYIIVKIEGNNILFGNTSFGARLTTIDGLKLSYEGVIKSFPDLSNIPKENNFWRAEAIRRFKEHIKSMSGDKIKAKYVIDELKQHGYILKKMKQNGFREENY